MGTKSGKAEEDELAVPALLEVRRGPEGAFPLAGFTGWCQERRRPVVRGCVSQQPTPPPWSAAPAAYYAGLRAR